MTSSISNSDSAEPRWVAIWLVTLLIASVFIGAWELLARNARLGPGLVDNETLWADTRHQLNQQGRDAIVLIGGSRMQRAIDVETMHTRFDRPVLQLSVEWSSYLPVLEDLAADPRVTGTVLVSITPALTFNRKFTQLDNGRQAQYVAKYRQQSRARRLEQKLTLFLQEHLALRSPHAQPSIVVSSLLERGELPKPHYKTVFRDRVAHIDPDLMTVEQSDKRIVEVYRENAEPYTEVEFAPFVNYISTLVGILEQKGADVYFVRLPSAGAVREYEEKLFPREKFWGALEASVDATFVHYEDHPQLVGFVSRDGSHIESTRIVEFTRRLSDVLTLD